ncbi:MAG: DNA segregation ATPase FtsK/SpoIIIE S-DNA-T family [Chloroflexi bacterium]|nr:MAG: DNA segregation ATPase FtsK/SpoIIIE S-DNA-T family [Chloroflexota bacterium]MBA4376446.1 cell division protein FtsK [Anaerolinea sp.]
MPKTPYSRSANTKKNAAPARRGTKKSAKRNGVSNLTTEQKVDFIGGLIAVVGILSLVALFTRNNGPLTGWVAQTMSQIAGWGGFIIPVAMTVGGLYLLLRKVEKLPRLSGGRIAGIVLVYLNVLTWLHFLDGGGFTSAHAGLGGGYIGGGFDAMLHASLGAAGEVVVLIAWLLISVIFIVDISIPELAAWVSGNVKKVAQPKLTGFSQERTRPYVQQRHIDTDDSVTLPQGFNPLDLSAESTRAAQLRQRRELSTKPGATGQPFTLPSTEKINAAPTVHVGVSAFKPEKPWLIPAIADILDPASPATVQSHYDKDRARIIVETLASFGAPCHIVEIHRGPAVTQFGVEPDFIENRAGRTRVRVSRIVSLADDLALTLAAPSIRIQAPVPGKAYVGIEVPNTELTLVSLRELLENDAFRKIKSSLRFALGKDVAGKPVCADLTAMPHLLVAGTTNSGKSVLVNAILTSLLLNNSPTDLRLLLVDPKRVELTGYNGIPHLLAPVVVEAERVVGALQWVLREMDTRYKKFAKAGARNIIEYNRKGEDHIPYLVIVIDELADLMMLAPDETERSITRLAQLARATGIHLIIATQRPSVDVVTGLIKANFPARVAFMVASNMDSRVILDQPGADKLLGRGDMLYQAPDAPAPVRLQGVYVSDSEIQRLVDSWRVIAMNRTAEGGEAPASLAMEMYTPGAPLKQGMLFDEGERAGDPLLKDAMEIVRREGKASISMLQRKMRVGYTRAARLVDTLEDQGIIGPQQHGSQVREVLDYGDSPTADETVNEES